MSKTISKKERTAYWQPTEEDLIKHEIPSFAVWRRKKNLLKEFPKCTPLPYTAGSIEEPTYMD